MSMHGFGRQRSTDSRSKTGHQIFSAIKTRLGSLANLVELSSARADNLFVRISNASGDATKNILEVIKSVLDENKWTKK